MPRPYNTNNALVSINCREVINRLYRLNARSDRARRRASTNLHTSNERCQFKLYIGYWTSNNNKWPKCSCNYRSVSTTRVHGPWTRVVETDLYCFTVFTVWLTESTFVHSVVGTLQILWWWWWWQERNWRWQLVKDAGKNGTKFIDIYNG